MRLRITLFAALAAMIIAGCSSCGHKNETPLAIRPDAGDSYKLGDVIPVSVQVPSDVKTDSVVYLVDSVRFASRKDTLAAKLNTALMACGSKLITARVYSGGKAQEVSTNVIIKAAKPPVEYTYKVEKVFPHDTTSYTEGLQYLDGNFYESTGEDGKSHLLRVDVNSGKILQSAKLADKYFGEGFAIVVNKIFMLTYKEKMGFIFDKKTFKVIDSLNYNWGPEGWGVCVDGDKIYQDDSTNRIWILSKDTFKPTGAFIDVYDDKGPINAVNELEMIDGLLYANVYTTDNILVIDPKTGAVLQKIDMKGIYPESSRPANFDYGNNVLNGIAYDKTAKRIFVTGKKWPHVYEVKFVKK
jgi:glutamine cyclotransferase